MNDVLSSSPFNIVSALYTLTILMVPSAAVPSIEVCFFND